MPINTILKYLVLLFCICLYSSLYSKEKELKNNVDTYQDIINMINEAERMPYSNPQKTLTLASKIISYGKAKNIDWIVAKGKLIAGYAYGNFGDFVTGFEYIQKALDYCPSDSLQLQANILLKKSSFYIYMRELIKAKSLTTQAIDIANLVSDSILLATAYNTMGLINIHVPDIELAELNFRKSMDINEKMGYERGISKNLNNLCLYKGDNLQERVDFLYRAIDINSRDNEYWSLAENYNNLGIQYYHWGEYNNALDALNTARSFAEKVNARELIQDNNRYFANVYSAMKSYNLAFNYLKLVLDEVEKEKITDKIREYQTKILQSDIENKERSIKEQKQQFKVTIMKYVFAVVLLILVSLVCALAYMFNNMKNKHIMEEASNATKELKNIKDQLTNTAVLVKSRGDMLNNIQNKIRESYKLSDEKRMESLHKISRSITHFNSKNNEMEILVDKVSSEFINKLSCKYPDLTQNEKRLAALLRIGLTSKEIAIIISSQPKSVDMARYRLRKKMSLDCDEGLQECLSKV